MIFKEFIEMYDNWNEKLCVNDNNLNKIIEDITYKILADDNYKYLFNYKVISFGFYEDTMCVRLNI